MSARYDVVTSDLVTLLPSSRDGLSCVTFDVDEEQMLYSSSWDCVRGHFLPPSASTIASPMLGTRAYLPVPVVLFVHFCRFWRNMMLRSEK